MESLTSDGPWMEGKAFRDRGIEREWVRDRKKIHTEKFLPFLEQMEEKCVGDCT